MYKCVLWVIWGLGLSLAQSDTTKPLVTLGSSALSVNRAQTLNLSANAIDSGGIRRVEFYRNGVQIHEGFEAPYNLSLDVSQADNGTLEFYVVAYDNAGNFNSSKPVTVTINIAEPTLKGVDDFYATLVNTPLDVGMNGEGSALRVQGNLLQNDGLENARISGSSNVVGGALELSPTGTFVFIPAEGFIGQAGFTYTLESAAGPASASVTITVQEANPEVAGNQMIWYVQAGAGGNGSATKPFGTLAEAEAASQEGDVIFVFSGDYSCEDTCFTLKSYQTLMGQASPLTLGEASFEVAEAPLLRGASTGFILASQTSIKGFYLEFASEFSVGIRGDDLLAGPILIEDVTIDTPGAFGIIISETDAKDSRTGARHSLTIRNVTVNNPGKMGILSNDALGITLENVAVNGVRRHPEDGFSGRGIHIESEFNTNVVISNTTVTSTATDELKGIYILKNNAFGNAQSLSNMNVVLNSNTVNLGENGLAYQLEVFAGTPDFPADTGTLTVSGNRNTTSNAQIIILSPASATLRGTVEVNGLVYPQ